jgi:hypothetical protein
MDSSDVPHRSSAHALLAFDDRFCIPRKGHELTSVDAEGRYAWCVRCGVLWLESPKLMREGAWISPSQSGRAVPTAEAPACLPATDVGAANVAGDARLMLRALTHGWKCEPLHLPSDERVEAWRWSHDQPLRIYTYWVPGVWADGPAIDATLRRELLVTTS